jgi:hypothetical protein
LDYSANFLHLPTATFSTFTRVSPSEAHRTPLRLDADRVSDDGRSKPQVPRGHHVRSTAPSNLCL